jgi:hypothetical protein
MSATSMHDVQTIILGLCLLLMGAVNIYTLLKLLPHIDAEDKHIGELSRLNAITQAAVEKLLASNTLSSASDVAWDQIDEPLQNLADIGIRSMHEVIGESKGILLELDGMSKDDFVAWRDANALRIQKLLATQEIQHRELEKTQTALDRARATILTLRSQPAVAGAGERRVALAKSAPSDVPSKVSPNGERESKEREINRLNQANTQLRENSVRLEQEKAHLRESLDKLQALHTRTLQEKNFVEEAFVRFDQNMETTKTPESGVVRGGARPIDHVEALAA